MISHDAIVSDPESLNNGIKPSVLTFSGSDSAGLAGMQMDVKVQHALAVHCTSVLTAVTAQNNQQVFAVNAVDSAMFRAQIEAVSVFRPKAIKTGFVASEAQAQQIIAVRQRLKIPLICDPVGAATSGAELHGKRNTDSHRNINRLLLAHCSLLTPNIPEAQSLVGFDIETAKDLRRAARALVEIGAQAVLIKGGHWQYADHMGLDFFYSPEEQFWLQNEPVDTPHTRGTGCALASAIASAIALGYCLKDAIVIGKMAITQGLHNAKGLLAKSVRYQDVRYQDTHDKQRYQDTHDKQIKELASFDTPELTSEQSLRQQQSQLNYQDTHDKQIKELASFDTPELTSEQSLRQQQSQLNYQDTHNKGGVEILCFPATQRSLPGLYIESLMATSELSSLVLQKQENPFPGIGDESLGLYPVVDRAHWLDTLLPLGVTTIQLRIKDLTGQSLEEEIKRAVEIATRFQCRLFINDYWQLAIKHGAYGVHLGQEDLVAAAQNESNPIKQLLEAGMRLGISTHCHYEVARAHALKPSYIAYGPVFATQSKDMPWVPQGLAGLAYWQKLLDYPVVAIGGIDHERANAIHGLGVSGIAMISYITQAENPIKVTKSLLRALAL
ncbi:thiamine-phosphate diphosphorylase [Paraglaciecola sp. T6c]|uniref:thiamine phosphate synthase n=1 Tax=Pseudoalteromonas atlantica (strain T6c / ATCC BAA-1087) TaxID=3042615 RepID=UPI00005C59BA|nr:thiamine phosphate synthase [Paraglaciecola sp. T6c]ABG40453.1 thiamine-phosphate diphosphorylase [Paraglaciecola sp. T6c]